jgi:hypothetical protein
LTQHTLLALTAITRALSSARFGQLFTASRVVVAVVTALPSCLVFWSFSQTVVKWVSIVHYSMKADKNKTKSLRLSFLCVNACVSLAVLVLFVSLANANMSSSQANTIALVGSLLLTGCACILSITFIFYGTFLYRTLTARSCVRSSARNSSSVRRCCCNPSPEQKTLSAAVILSLLFLVEGAMTYLALPPRAGGDWDLHAVYRKVYLAADCMLMVATLLIYRHAVALECRTRRKGSSFASVLTGTGMVLKEAVNLAVK